MAEESRAIRTTSTIRQCAQPSVFFMTKEESDRSDVAAVQVYSAKELDAEFATMLTALAGKESEFNWEGRERSMTRLRGILRGNAAEKYPDSLLSGLRHMVDGIIKAVESLRTTLALKGLALVEDIARYVGKLIDDYTYEHILNCMIRCASVTKKLVAAKSKDATVALLSHCNYYHKTPRILGMAMSEKNHQTRLHVILFTRAVLQAHAPCERTRVIMDRKDGTKHLYDIITKGMSDATPAVREACREPFWIFWEYWRDQGENILKSLTPAIRKVVENSKSTTLSKQSKTPVLRRAASSLGTHRNVRDVHDIVSPSNSTTSNGSSGSLDISKSFSRPISPRAMSPSVRSTSPHHLRSYASPPPMPSQLHSSHMPTAPSPPRTPTTPTALSQRRSRVPLTRKKSTILKPKLGLIAMLNNDDLVVRCDGIKLLARKLAPYPYQIDPDVSSMSVEMHGSTTDGEKLRALIWGMFLEDNARLYEILSSWEGVAGVMLKLTLFDEYIPRLMLDASDDVRPKTQEEIDKHRCAQAALKRAKYVLNRRCPDLADCLYRSLLKYSGFAGGGGGGGGDMKSVKKEMRNPANRRTLTTQLIIWMDELVQVLLGGPENIVENDEDTETDTEANDAAEWLGGSMDNVASHWFESDAHVRMCLDVLLPAVSTSMAGTLWYKPLKELNVHFRRLNQALFDTIVMSTFDSGKVSKISRTLGIHIRLIPETGRLAELTSTSDVSQATILIPKQGEDIIAPLTTGDTLDIQVKELAMEVPRRVDDDATVTTIPILTPVIPIAVPYEIPPEPLPTSSLPSPVNITEEIIIEQPPASPPPSKRDSAQDMEFPVSETTAMRVSPLMEPALLTPVREASPSLDNSNAYPFIAEEELYIDPSDELAMGNDTVLQVEPALQDDPVVVSPSRSTQNESPPIKTKKQAVAMPDTPTSIPYFAPKTVIDPLRVFEQNHRASQTNDRNKDRSMQLYGLVDKMATSKADSSTFRKLMRLSEEAPVLKKWDQGGCDEPGSDVWAGADQDGGNFVETVQALTPYLSSDTSLATPALDLLQQLAIAQTGLFRFYERKVNAVGMSLEARLIERLLILRDSKDATMCTTVEGVLEAVLSALDPQTVLEVLLAYLAHILMTSPCESVSWAGRYHPVGSAFTYLGKWVFEINDTQFLVEWLEQGGARVFYRGMNDDRIHVRKTCVDAIVEFQEVLGDNIYTALDALREDQLNLIRCYVQKSTKKKASIRNLSATGQIR